MKIIITKDEFSIENASVIDSITGLCAGLVCVLNDCDTQEEKYLLANLILTQVKRAVLLSVKGEIKDENSAD